MKAEVRSITIYVREDQLDKFLKGSTDVVWALCPTELRVSFFAPRYVQMQVSLDTYYRLRDAQGDKCSANSPNPLQVRKGSFEDDMPF